MKDGRISRVTQKTALKHKRRYCKVEGCSRIVKSQGVCQRHGAKPRKCKIVDCPKQAQGNYKGMCKAHFRASQNTQLSSSITTPRHPEKATCTKLVCQPVIVPQDSVTDHDRQGPEWEESTIASSSAVTDEDTQGRELWDEPLFCPNATRSEELAADLFGAFPESSMTCEEWSGGQMSRKEDMMAVGNRVLAVSSIPSCSDYTPNFATSNFWEMRDASHSAFMDYYVHENANNREAI